MEDSSPLGKERKTGQGDSSHNGRENSQIIHILRNKGLNANTENLPETRRQATAGNTSGLRAPKPARESKTTSKLSGPKAKEGRESSGKKMEKEKRSQTSFLRKWLMDSGGTIDSGKRDGGGDSEVSEKERLLSRNGEESRVREGERLSEVEKEE